MTEGKAPTQTTPCHEEDPKHTPRQPSTPNQPIPKPATPKTNIRETSILNSQSTSRPDARLRLTGGRGGSAAKYQYGPWAPLVLELRY